MTTSVVTEADGVVVKGAVAELRPTLKRDGVAFTPDNLAGKTVQCSIRAVLDPNTPIDETLEGITCSVVESEDAEGDENVLCTLTDEMTDKLPTATNPAETRDFYAQFWIEDEDYVAPLMRFAVRRAAAVLN